MTREEIRTGMFCIHTRVPDFRSLGDIQHDPGIGKNRDRDYKNLNRDYKNPDREEKNRDREEKNRDGEDVIYQYLCFKFFALYIFIYMCEFHVISMSIHISICISIYLYIYLFISSPPLPLASSYFSLCIFLSHSYTQGYSHSLILYIHSFPDAFARPHIHTLNHSYCDCHNY